MKLTVKREITRLARFVLPSAVAAAMSALPCAAEEAAAAAAAGGLEDGAAAHKWFSFKAYADIETAYVCRGYVWDARHYRRLFGPKPGEPDSRYHGGLHALNLIVRLDYAITDWLGVYGFVGQFDLVSDDARDAVKASSAREAKRDLTYCGIGLEVDF